MFKFIKNMSNCHVLENNGHSKCLLFSGTYIVNAIMFLE